jgi:hypothetical protein
MAISAARAQFRLSVMAYGRLIFAHTQLARSV